MTEVVLRSTGLDKCRLNWVLLLARFTKKAVAPSPVHPGRRSYNKFILKNGAHMNAVYIYGLIVVVFVLCCIPLLRLINESTREHRQKVKKQDS